MKLLLPLLLTLGLVRAAENPPNVVFILADDLGITDIGAYARHFNEVGEGQLYFETPHLDRLVSDGIAFSQSYANQLCSPTRAAILTGRIASRLGVTTATPNTQTYYNQSRKVPDGYDPHDAFAHKDPIPGPLPWRNAHSNTALDPSVPTWPKVLGSHDCAFLGKWHLGGHGAPERQPAAHGFRELAFFDAGGSKYFNWQGDWNRTKPFFPTMPGKFRAGQAGPPTDHDYLTDDLSLRAVRFIESRKGKERPFVLYYCPFAVHTPFQAPKPGVDHFNAKKQRGNLGRTNATYAEMVKRLDASVGEIRETLVRTGLAKNTILIFTSDNGGVEYTDPPATDNQPFKGGKACLYEGGVRVPTVVWQPSRFEGGKWCDAVVDCTDFLPTVAELTGNPLPDDLDGRSMLPLLADPSSPGAERTLIWHYPFNVKVMHPDDGIPLPPHSAIRVGDHKLIWNWHGRLELYDIPKDPGESRDLSKEMPELTARLHERLKGWLKSNVAPRYMPVRDESVSPDAAGGAFPFRDLR
ncbi:sulfatase [Haloferula helveola]|uniref:Sulfatase n=1 Tax=Haloferula helveola TaxID=490095 RepID=A0ABM7RDQ7_9BACT|nr:sulfatase [Haloferula helveola]